MKKRVQSPSSINTYKQCPRKYYYMYIEKLPTKPSIHLVRGTIVHKVLEDFFDIDISTINIKNYPVELRKRMQSLFLHVWKEKQKDVQKHVTGDKEKFYFSESLLMISNWLEQFINKVKSFQQLSFKEIFTKLTPLREKHYQSYDLYVRGFIDAIEQIDGKINIIDYKTNSRLNISEEQKLQLAIYALLYKESHGKIPDRVGIFFLRSKAKYITLNEKLLEAAKKEIHGIHAKTMSRVITDYPLKTGPLCNWCDFYTICFEQTSVTQYLSGAQEAKPKQALR
jgi:putative RecB family exonuclease